MENSYLKLLNYWNPIWDSYDPNRIIKDYLQLGKNQISNSDYQVLASQIIFLKEELNKPRPDSELKNFYTLLKSAGIISCVESKLPFPYHLDNTCQTLGIYSEGLKNAKLPPNISLNNAHLSSVSSEVMLMNTSLSGNSQHISGDSSNINIYLGEQISASSDSQYSINSWMLIANVIGLFFLIIACLYKML